MKRLTDEQKRLRRYARRKGRLALQALNRSRYPVYDDDEQTWADLAVALARRAWALALLSQEEGAAHRAALAVERGNDHRRSADAARTATFRKTQAGNE